MSTIYQRLGMRTFINARGTITTLGGSIMPAEVVAAMVEASRSFVHLNELHQKAGDRIAELTGAEGAFISAGAASGLLLAGAAVLTGTDTEAIRNIPEVGDRPTNSRSASSTRTTTSTRVSGSAVASWSRSAPSKP